MAYSALYDEVVSNGWYEAAGRHPEQLDQLALTALIIAVVLTGILAAFTTFGLVGLALIVLALGLVFVAQEMPSRTAKGVALLGGLGAALGSDEPPDEPDGARDRAAGDVGGAAVRDRAGRVGPLAGCDRRVRRGRSSDSDQLTWYHGPDNWHLRDLPDSMKNFITTVSGSLFAR